MTRLCQSRDLWTGCVTVAQNAQLGTTSTVIRCCGFWRTDQADIACHTTSKLSPPATKRPSGKSKTVPLRQRPRRYPHARLRRHPRPRPPDHARPSRRPRPRRPRPHGRPHHRQRRCQPAPLRIVLGSQALQSTIDTLRTRVACFGAPTGLAASTDFPPGESGVRHARTQAAGQRPTLAAAVGHKQSIVSHQQRLLCAEQDRSALS
jgi:hypothetical protein